MTRRNVIYWFFFTVVVIAPPVGISFIVRFRALMVFPMIWYSGLLYWGTRITANNSKRRGTVTEFELIRKKSKLVDHRKD